MIPEAMGFEFVLEHNLGGLSVDDVRITLPHVSHKLVSTLGPFLKGTSINRSRGFGELVSK